MKKINNGFTLVELLAVIAIIGVLAVILLPTIEKMTKENREKVYQQQLDNIVLSLKSWASDNRIYLPEEENENLTITLGNLKSEGYIEYDVKNPLIGKCFSNDMLLIITKIKKNYDYSIDLSTIKESNECEIDAEAPVIILNGNVVENVEVNSIYVDKGVSAKDKEGNDITGNVAVVITGSGNVVDTSTIGNDYIITYSVTANEKTIQASRTVRIVDTEAPELIIPGDVLLDTSITSFDVMNGVSATDNSGEEISVSSTNNITFGNVGKYTITYKVTDSSDNTIIKKRIVTISKVVNGIMSSNSNCIKDIALTCPNGTEISVQVNDTQSHNFYVIKDTGTKLTLIMDRNLGGTIAWYAPARNHSNGPVTAIDYLDVLTANEWANIPTKPYTYSGLSEDNQTKLYEDITKVMKARMITHSELMAIRTANGGVLPSYLAGDTNYWTLTARNSGSTHSWFVRNGGSVDTYPVDSNDSNGVRPVIELSK